MNERTDMEPTNTLAALAAKPLTGMTISGSAYLLHLLGILTPIFAFLTICVGLVAGIYSLLHKRNEVKRDLERERKQLCAKNDCPNRIPIE